MSEINREKLQLSKEDARELIWGGGTGEYETISDKNNGSSRWSERRRIVIKRISDGKFFCDTYSKGLTECQDESPFDDEDPDFTEVFPVEKKYINYE